MTAPPRLLPLATPDGWTIHLEEHAGTAPSRGGAAPAAALLLVPGMMLDRRAMDRPAGRGIASFFRARGYAVYALDLRGHGASRPAASAAVDWSYDDLVALDLPVALAAVAARHPGLPLAVLGHSLGAIAAATAIGCRPELPADLLVLLAPAIWIRPLEPSLPVWLTKRALLELWAVVARRLGYWPGGRLGLGTDDESRSFVEQFRAWGASGRWTSRDGAVDYLAALRGVGRPTLVVHASADPIGRGRTARRLARALGGAPVEVWQVAARDLGRRRPPMHMALAVDPACAGVWERIDAWMRRQLAARREGKRPG
jgi:alpha-beta hydrolase superfamily lysophospholipase